MKDIPDTVNDDVCTDCCYVMGYNYVRTVSRTEGYCLYGTLLLCPRWTACPVQIGAHHHIDVYTDINYTNGPTSLTQNLQWKSMSICVQIYSKLFKGKT